MQTIHKYRITVTDRQTIQVPKGADLLGIQMQHGEPCIWAMVETSNPAVSRKIVVHGTGHKITDPTLTYIGTFQMEGGHLVFHAFESHQ